MTDQSRPDHETICPHGSYVLDMNRSQLATLVATYTEIIDLWNQPAFVDKPLYVVLQHADLPTTEAVMWALRAGGWLPSLDSDDMLPPERVQQRLNEAG